LRTSENQESAFEGGDEAIGGHDAPKERGVGAYVFEDLRNLARKGLPVRFKAVGPNSQSDASI